MALALRPRQSFVVALVGSLCLALGYAAESVMTASQAPRAERPVPPGSGRSGGAPFVSDRYPFNPDLYPWRIFDAGPPRAALPTLQVMTGGASSDEEAIGLVVEVFRHERSRLARDWGERHPDRLKALFAMYVIHISHPYGPGTAPRSFLRYLREHETANCVMYASFQSRLLSAFRQTWRYVAVSSGQHGWIEVDIDGRWEVFDATTNLWIDRSGFELLAGGPRRYRTFYRPWSDKERPDARRSITGAAEPYPWGPGMLRSRMIGLGISYLTEEELASKGLSLQVWEGFRPPTAQPS